MTAECNPESLSLEKARLLRALGGRKGRLSSLPLAGGWTDHRDFPAPQGKSFQELWAKRQNGSGGPKA